MVNPTPVKPTVKSNGPVCSGSDLQLESATTTPGAINYSWTGPDAFTSKEQNPAIPAAATTASGTYTVTATLGDCSAQSTLDVVVRPTPVIARGASKDPDQCNTATGAIQLEGLTTGKTYLVTYTYGGSVQTENGIANASGHVVLSGLKAGTYSNIKVILDGCPSNEVGPFTLNDPNPPAAPTISGNSAVCTEGTLRLEAATTTGGPVTWSWSGPGSFTSDKAVVSLTGMTPAQGGTYTVTVSQNGCTAAQSINVVVNPKPRKPAVGRPVRYCLNAVTAPLNATAESGHTLTWYDNKELKNGSATAPTPSAAVAGTVYYYVLQTNASGCASDTAALEVTVYPAIGTNTVSSDQVICSGQTPAAFTGSVPTGGNGTYTYQWQVSTDGTTWNDIPGATGSGYQPGPLMDTTLFRRVVASGPCDGVASAPLTITVQGVLSGIQVSGPQTICAGTKPQALSGQTPSGGSGTYTFQWESAPDGSNWTSIAGATGKDYAPGILTATMHFRRRTTSGSCFALSDALILTVNPKPVMDAVGDKILCASGSVPAVAFTGTPAAGVRYDWTNSNEAIGLAASGSGNLPAFTAAAATGVPVTATISVQPVFSANGTSCPGAPHQFTFTVLPRVTVKPVQSLIVCTGSSVPALTPEHDADATGGGTVQYTWTVAGDGISLQSGSGTTVPAFTTLNPGTSDLQATITLTPQYHYGGAICPGTPVTYTVTVKPATPDASAGPDVTLCAAATYTMKAAASGVSGQWRQIAGPTAVMEDATSPVSGISGLREGNTYRFEWTVTGFANCPPSLDTVTIIVERALVNELKGGPVTLCAGQQIVIAGGLPEGGSGAYRYQWQTSPNGTDWADLPGEQGQHLTFIPVSSIQVRRLVQSGSCSGASNAIAITVQPPVSGNTIVSDTAICIRTEAPVLKGSVPSGGDGRFAYQWQQSANGTDWTDLPGATGEDYAPGVLTASTYYRRIVKTDLCAGPQSSVSNRVLITVRPDALAALSWQTEEGCAPFRLEASNIRLKEDAARNRGYEWYVDGNLIGTGITFPGYTIRDANDTVEVLLRALSLYGCVDDTARHSFRTYRLPAPSFTQSKDEGCGPLTVDFTNTTPDAKLFHHRWDFGNGQVSTDIQPGSVIFAPNPTYGDTTYTVTLRVWAACDTMTVQKQVLVRARPKALFTPDRTVGCSPMPVHFNNTSLGLNATYEWHFGDGQTITSAGGPVTHTYTTGVLDTFHVKLVATNGCGSDTMQYAIVVSPNTIKLDFAVNGNEQNGCAPHTVRFVNNTRGATSFLWNFGDGNIRSTTRNIDTVVHTFQVPGTYEVQLRATNTCSDTTAIERITVYPRPKPVFDASAYTLCLGDSVWFTNTSEESTSYLWKFGDGTTSTRVSPAHVYRVPGLYDVVLTTFRTNAPGSTCSDSLRLQVRVVAEKEGMFDVTNPDGACAPHTVSFANRNLPAVTTEWDFGDGTTGTGNTVSHTFLRAGTYTVRLTAKDPGGCTYVTTRTVRVSGPDGQLLYKGGFVCNDAPVRFEASASGTDSVLWQFGDGTVLKTTERVVFHTYPHAGVYRPSVTLINDKGCSFRITGSDSVRVDRISGGYTAAEQKSCGYTDLVLTDTARAFFGVASVHWDFGDGTSASGNRVSHRYTASGSYVVRQTVTGHSGCVVVTERTLAIAVQAIPVTEILTEDVLCAGPVELKASVRSDDPLSVVQWSLSNGMKGSTNPLSLRLEAGTYTVRFIAGTEHGCFDTVQKVVRVHPSPLVRATPDQNICRGASVSLQASGAATLSWSPLESLSCYDCPAPVARPLQTTPFVVAGTNAFGCTGYDTTVVTVIQPLKLNAPREDSICIGASTQLVVSGATHYRWSPGGGLSAADVPNPVAAPARTTRYRVVGYDGFNCFTDTAYVLVAVGPYPTVNIGADQVLSTGTQYTFAPKVTGGPIRTWEWSPSVNLSCADCPTPVAHVKKDITYIAKVTSGYGCSASDTMQIRVFCENTQVFVPNAFSPDNDGVNDRVTVRAKGILHVKSFRIFNRWGELVFERSNFVPNDLSLGWDGTIRGARATPDVYVYTAEVICENGVPYTYKGNITLLK
ncbi:MAG TPA: PKD domain-containing protein [Chitinophagaceae bacterium]|nr:PKD domain-containing protein [Chitinophagaceae bacterium]